MIWIQILKFESVLTGNYDWQCFLYEYHKPSWYKSYGCTQCKQRRSEVCAFRNVCVVTLHLALLPGDVEICILLILEMLGSDIIKELFCRSSALTLALVAALSVFHPG